MACTPGFIAAEGLWAPLLPGASTRRCRGPLLLSLLTGTFRSSSVPVRMGGATRLWGAFPPEGPDCREEAPVPPRPLTCHPAWYNRNVCVLLTLERQSVNVLTCEFAHRNRGPVDVRRVSWGRKRGRRGARPSRSAHPTGTAQQARGQPPDTEHNPRSPQPGNNPNEHAAEPERPTRTATTPLPQRTTQPEHNPQDKPPATSAHPIRKELQPTRRPPTNSLHHPTEGRPEPRPAAHQADGGGS